MTKLKGKQAAKIPGNGGYVNEGPDLQPKQPTPLCVDKIIDKTG